VTLIGRGQVHVFQGADIDRGAVLRFGDELLHEGSAARAAPGWLMAGAGGCEVPVPEGEMDALDAALAAWSAARWLRGQARVLPTEAPPRDRRGRFVEIVA
jgi:AraC family transcriptional activator of pobA